LNSAGIDKTFETMQLIEATLIISFTKANRENDARKHNQCLYSICPNHSFHTALSNKNVIQYPQSVSRQNAMRTMLV
jgi:hypothetical protein